LTETVSTKPSFSRILSNRPFALLWLGQLVSQSGDFIFDVVALWLVLQLTGDVFKVGLTTATIFLPAVIVGPVAGVYVDKLNRRDIILASNIFQGAIVAGIAALYSVGRLDFPVLLALLFLLNAGAQFVRPSVNAAIPGLAAKEDLAAANSLFSISASVNQIAGFGIGGLMILLLGVTIPIYYDAFTFIFAAASVWFISRSTLGMAPVAPSTSVLDGLKRESFREKFMQGIHFITKSRFLLELIALAIVLNFFAGGVQTLLAPYSKITVHGNAGTYGAMLAALSLGTVIGSVFIGKIEARKYVGRLLFIGVLGAGASIALMGLTTVALLAVGFMFLIGVGIAVANLPLQVLIQTKVPGQMLGRVFTSLGALVTIATPVAAVTTGSVARSLAIGSTLQIYGGLMVAVTVGSYFVFKDIREASY
jgi:MFS transporter, DHA3 family, macrolide efflux protein